MTEKWLDIISQQPVLFRKPLTQLVQGYYSKIIPENFSNAIAATQQNTEYWNLYSSTCDYLANLLILLDFCNEKTARGGIKPGLTEDALVYVLTR